MQPFRDTRPLPQGLRQALDVDDDFQDFQRRFDLDAQHCPQVHYPCQFLLPFHDHLQFIPVGNNGDPGVVGGFAVMMFLDIAQG